MIAVNIAEIEKLADLLAKVSADTEEVLSRIRNLSYEMQEDTELPMYTQTDVILESMDLAVASLNRGSDSLQTLKNVMIPVADIYRENERKNKDALARMTAYMDNVNAAMYAAVTSESIAGVEHDEIPESLNRVQELVAQSSEDMQIANIAAITKVVREEYEVNNVQSLGDDR